MTHSKQAGHLAGSKVLRVAGPLGVAAIAGLWIADAATTTATVITFVAFALPGFIVFRRLTSATVAVVYGVPLGYALTSLTIIAAVGLGGWNMPAIGCAYALLLAIVYVIGRVTHGRRDDLLSMHGGGDAELPPIVAITLATFVLLLSVPLAHAGSLTERGYAFVGLFGHDFILRATDSVALAQSIPADNFFFRGQSTKNYYILWYILPATIFNLLGKSADATKIVAAVSLISVPVFGMLVYFALESFVKATTQAAVASTRLAIIFLLLFASCYSYHWLFYGLTHALDPAVYPAVDRVSHQMGPVSTSWFKDLLFQPHSVLALMLLLASMYLILHPPFPLRGLWVGLLLGSMLITDSVVFLMIGSGFGVWYLFKVFDRTRISELALMFGSVACVVALCLGIHEFGSTEYSNKIVFLPYMGAIAGLPLLLPLCLGAMPILALLAWKQRAWHLERQTWLLVALLIAALFFMLCITEVLEGNVFLRKAFTVARLPLLLLSGRYLYSFLRPTLGVSLLVLLAAPTLITDTYATSDTSDARHADYVSKEDMAAALWVRGHTGRGAVVQSLIEYPGQFEYSLTVSFGYRRAALGHWKMAYQRYPNKAALDDRVREVKALYMTSSDDERLTLAKALDINYLYAGPQEEAQFPGISVRLDADILHFKPVYRYGQVSIYQVVGGSPMTGSHE
jgi:hypothetical protein